MKAGVNSRLLFRAVSVFAAVAAIGCAQLLIQNRRMRAELAARPVITETRGKGSIAAAITEKARPAAERPLADEPAPEPIAPAAPVDMHELRQTLIDALMLADSVEQWLAIKRAGVEPENDDFRRTLGNLGDSGSSYELSGLVRQWAALDPKAAAAWIMELGENRERQKTALWALLPAWKKVDPGGMRQWVADLPQGVVRDQAASYLAEDLAKTDPADAAKVALWINEESKLFDAFKKIVPRWVGEDSEAARRWLQALPEGRERDAFTVAMAHTLSSKAPAEAAALLAQIKGENFSQRVVHEVMSHWAGQDPAAAVQWLTGLPDGPFRNRAAYEFAVCAPNEQWATALKLAQSVQGEESRQRAVLSAIAKWVEHDPATASEWLNLLSPGYARDHAVCSFVERLQNFYPADAVQWAMAIGDETARELYVSKAVTSWLEADRAAAMAWLQNARLAEETKQALLVSQEEQFFDWCVGVDDLLGTSFAVDDWADGLPALFGWGLLRSTRHYEEKAEKTQEGR